MSQVDFRTLSAAKVQTLGEFHSAALAMEKYLGQRAVVALSGPLGAGKTEWVRVVAESRGCQNMASPTFAIHNRYLARSFHVDHLDLYRLQFEEELEATGFWDFFSEPQGLIFIEWPERMDLAHIPWDWQLFRLSIELLSDGGRELILALRH